MELVTHVMRLDSKVRGSSIFISCVGFNPAVHRCSEEHVLEHRPDFPVVGVKHNTVMSSTTDQFSTSARAAVPSVRLWWISEFWDFRMLTSDVSKGNLGVTVIG